ncbi:MAG: DUF456 domain-containing protein [Patescibacteria group bacterium]
MLEVIFFILLFCCLAFTLIPTIPGVPMMFLLTLGYSALSGFERIGAQTLVALGVIALITIAIDYSSGLIGAKLGGASKKALIAGMLGLLIGVILFPPFGAFIGLFIGVFVAEIVQFNDHYKAIKAASYSLAAALAGAITNILFAITFFIIALVAVV